MRILLLSADPPSPIRVRPYQLARALVARGQQVDLAFPVAGPRAARDARRLEDQGFRSITRRLPPVRRFGSMASALLAGRPLQSGFSWSPPLLAAVQRALEDAASAGRPYDVIHIEHLRGSSYARRLAARWPVVWDAVDSITDLFAQAGQQARRVGARWMARFELPPTRREEGRLLDRLDRVAVTARTDRAALQALWLRHRFRSSATAIEPASSGPEIRVIPNGVDLRHFAPGDAAAREPASLLFSGKLGYHANEAAALHLIEAVMPRIWHARSDVRLILAGAQAPASLRRSADRDARIELTGFVEDMREPLCRASLAVAPLVYGVGIQNKLLEAMACATPVVATPVAARALGARDGEEILVGHDPGELAELVLALLGEPDRAAEIGRAGRGYVERAHDWDDAARRFESLYAAAGAG